MPNEEMCFCQSAWQPQPVCEVIPAEDETLMLLKPKLAQSVHLVDGLWCYCHATLKGLCDDKGGLASPGREPRVELGH